MKKILLINAHQPYPFSEGKLTASLLEIANEVAKSKNYEIQTSNVLDYDVEKELEKHTWADVILFQFLSNWMMIPWSAKKYMDDVFTAGMSGILCNTDGRTRENPKKNYGTGGLLKGKKYMLSATFNAPKEAFDNSEEYLFQGKSVDDLFFPIHANYRFFAMEKLPTFACFDVVKNPQIEKDFEDFKKHLETYL